MPDPLGLIPTNLSPVGMPGPRRVAGEEATSGPSFKDALLEQIGRVNELQRKADMAIEELGTGSRDDIEEVMLATLEADTAFRMLLQVRNKVMDAYEEVKQIRI